MHQLQLLSLSCSIVWGGAFFFIIIISLLTRFFHQGWMMVFHASPSDSESPHVSNTRFPILIGLNNIVICKASILPLISISSSCLYNPFGTIPSAPSANGIIVIFIFYRCFVFSQSSFIFFTFFYFLSVDLYNGKIHHIASFLFFQIISSFGLLVRIGWFICISKSQRIFSSHVQGKLLVFAYTIC